jgi:putative hydrolase of the HAD superfamily
MKKYHHIYFDLDRTLWDFNSNSRKALSDIFHNYRLSQHFQHVEEFLDIYNKHNERLWDQYRRGNLTKAILRSKRFELTLKEKKIIDRDLAEKIGEDYLDSSTLQTILFPNTHEILSYLAKKYDLYILTNGFSETQKKKLKNCELESYFLKLFTSETIGYNKPHSKIFQWALSSVNAKKEDSLMIGDDQLVDIEGARRYGIDTVFFNPTRMEQVVSSSYTIHNLIELKEIL